MSRVTTRWSAVLDERYVVVVLAAVDSSDLGSLCVTFVGDQSRVLLDEVVEVDVTSIDATPGEVTAWSHLAEAAIDAWEQRRRGGRGGA